MSRYEWVDAAAFVDCLPANELDLTGNGWALVVGDPSATALVVEGTRDDLLALIDRASAAVYSTFIAEHSNALHLADPEPRCPGCAADADSE